MKTPQRRRPICIHCERQADEVNLVGLCPCCASLPQIACLYVRRRRRWNPTLENRLCEFRRRANAQLPLFE